MGRKVWNISTYDKKAAAELANKLGADDFAVLLLQSRGITGEKEISAFLSAADSDISSPFLLKDMEKAASRIIEAIEDGEHIHIFGDYDADGVTATALLTSYLEAIGAFVTCSIPSRLNEGYGLSPEAAHRIASEGARLVVTVDNGIASFAEAEIFRGYGIDFIITDHHKVGDSIPDAYAVVDPHREDDDSPEENLAGVGVALKLIAAIEGGDYSAVLDDFGDLAAIGTIADIVPLTGENRIITSKGLKSINNSFRPGLMALLEGAGIKEGEITASSVAFAVAPRINAAGRIDSAETALRLLMTDDEEEARVLTEKLLSYNTTRQSVENKISEEIEEYFEKNPMLKYDSVIVAYGNNWHLGVIGIAASRLVEKYGRPALVISVDENGLARGSARSIEGFSLYDALSFCSELLIQFGGHTLAAGFSIDKNNLDAFRIKINEYAAMLPPFYPSMDVDIRLNPKAVSADILDSIAVLEPCGAGNPSPTFGLFGMTIASLKPIGGDKHMRLTLTKEGCSVPAVYFGQTPDSFPYEQGDEVDLAVKIEKNEFRGEIRVSIQIKDMRPAGENDREMFRSLHEYRRFIKGEELSAEEKAILCPDRALLGDVYRFIRSRKIWNKASEILCMKLNCSYERAGAVNICLDALTDVGILERNADGFVLTDFSGKADLKNCDVLKKLGYKEDK